MGKITKYLSLPFRVITAPFRAVRHGLDRLIVDQGARVFRLEVQQAITAMILGSVGRWIFFILVIITSHVMALALQADVRIFVAFGILLGIYGYYVLVTLRITHFCIDIWRRNGMIWNPLDMAYLYIYDMVVSEIHGNKYTRVAFAILFPRQREKHIGDLASHIIAQGIKNNNLWICVAARILLYGAGWGIYLLCYENVFLYATDINFKNWYEPLIWPIVTVGKFLGV